MEGASQRSFALSPTPDSVKVLKKKIQIYVTRAMSYTSMNNMIKELRWCLIAPFKIFFGWKKCF